MAEPRRLAAILAADIVGYSALMAAAEARTVRDLKDHQAAVLPLIDERGGRVVDTAGDGILTQTGRLEKRTWIQRVPILVIVGKGDLAYL